MELSQNHQSDGIGTLLLDDFSRKVLSGALRVVEDKDNPLRLTMFSVAIRELLGHSFHKLGPEQEVTRCAWFVLEPGQDKPTRAQRAKYATQGGISDAFISEAGADVKHLQKPVLKAIQDLNKYTHVRAETLVEDDVYIQQFVNNTLSAVASLFLSVQDCREKIKNHVSQYLLLELGSVISSSFTDLNYITIDHEVTGITVSSISIIKIDSQSIEFSAIGTVDVEFRWDPESAMQGAELNFNLPFTAEFTSPTDDVFRLSEIEWSVSTRHIPFFD